MSSLSKHQALLLAGLARAYATSNVSPLHPARAQSGLFPATAIGKSAAQAAIEAGWLVIERTETKGKSSIRYVTLSTTGAEFLLEQSDPKPLLELVHHQLKEEESALREMQARVASAIVKIETMHARVDQLAAMVTERQIIHTRVSVPPWEDRLTEYLSQRQSIRPSEDCPLPELYREAKSVVPDLSVGSFHDGLRRLHDQRRIALQPWTGPLHELPDPGLALLQGHSLAFYASSS